jgi:2-methylcitrate dehydratase PrpD
MIVRGQIGPAELAAETLKDPEILRISNATQLIDDPHLTQISKGKRWAQVSLRLRDGRICESAPRSPRGDVDMPLTDAEISQKFHLFADPILGVKNAEILETLCANFDQLDAPGLQSLLELVLSKPQI